MSLVNGHPQELINLILSYLGRDVDSFRRCSLVARSFVIPARRALFASVTLTQRSCKRLHKVLLSNGHLASFVRELRVLNAGWTLDDRTFPRVVQLLVDSSTLQAFSFSLHYPNVTWASFPYGLKNAIRKIFASPHLRAIALCGLVTRGFEVELLSSVPTLRKLAFSSNRYDYFLREPTLVDAQSSPSTNDGLESLMVGCDNESMKLIEYLERPNCPLRTSEVRQLSLDPGDTQLFSAAARVMACTTKLECLCWNYPLPLAYYYPRASFTSSFATMYPSTHSSSSNQLLRPNLLDPSATIRVLIFRVYHRDTLNLVDIMKAFESYASIERVAVIITLSSADSIKPRHLDQLHQMLQHTPLDHALEEMVESPTKYPNLHQVDIHVLVQDAHTLDQQRRRTSFSRWFSTIEATGRLSGGIGDLTEMGELMRGFAET